MFKFDLEHGRSCEELVGGGDIEYDSKCVVARDNIGLVPLVDIEALTLFVKTSSPSSNISTVRWKEKNYIKAAYLSGEMEALVRFRKDVRSIKNQESASQNHP